MEIRFVFNGTNITSPTNFYAWSSGYTNRYDFTQSFGDHEATVILANLAVPTVPGPIISISTNGTFATNIIFPQQPFVSGDVVGKDAVMALEFYIDGQPHYGYIHCDFRSGASGLVYGWAYETEPNVPIVAESLAPQSPPAGPQAQEHSGVVGVVDQGNPSGWTVSVSTTRGNFVTSVQTDDQGFFKVNLKPGVYRLQSRYMPQAAPGQPISTAILIGVSKTVAVRRDHFTFIELVNKAKFMPLYRSEE